jgi:hypothetical protein
MTIRKEVRSGSSLNRGELNGSGRISKSVINASEIKSSQPNITLVSLVDATHAAAGAVPVI